MNTEEQAKKYQKIVAKAWADEAFKERLLANPSEVLGEEGIDLPKDVEIRVVEATSSVHYFVLPPKPDAVGAIDDLEVISPAYSSGHCVGGCLPCGCSP